MDVLQRRFRKRHSTLTLCILAPVLGSQAESMARGSLPNLNRFTVRLCEKAKVPPFNLHQLRHLATSILKDKGHMSLAQLQRFLRHDHQKTTEIYAGHIEMGTKNRLTTWPISGIAI
jgi:integrase